MRSRSRAQQETTEEAAEEASRIQAEIMVQEGYPERLARCEMLEKELRKLLAEMDQAQARSR